MQAKLNLNETEINYNLTSTYQIQVGLCSLLGDPLSR